VANFLTLTPVSVRIALLLVIPLLVGCNRPPVGEAKPFPDGFAWGAGSASYEKDHLSAAEAALLQAIGLTHYRLSLDWNRIMPGGTGPVDQAGLDHYAAILDNLHAVGIEPVIALHHWKLPDALEERGGWDNRESVDWFAAYASLAFDEFGDRGSLWITMADPYMDGFLNRPAEELLEAAEAAPATPDNAAALSRAPPFVQARRAARAVNPLQTSGAELAHRAARTHNMLLAHARAVENYRARAFGGQIGITIRLSPVYPVGNGDADLALAELEDGIRNRWYLDPLLRGSYPEDVLALYLDERDLGIQEGDLDYIAGQGTDFVGVDYFAPTRVEIDTLSNHFGYRLLPNRDGDKSFFGEAYADGILDVLTRLTEDYDNPAVYVTANGAGYGRIDELNDNSRIRDELRVRFMRRHFVQAQKAAAQGADLRGFFVWSAFDGPNWAGDLDEPTGLIHVDFETGEMLFKDSARYYRSIVAQNAVSRMPF
jgi:beta-glucosidase